MKDTTKIGIICVEVTLIIIAAIQFIMKSMYTEALLCALILISLPNLMNYWLSDLKMVK